MDTYYGVMVLRQRLVLAAELEKWRTLALVSLVFNVVATVIFLIGGAN